MAQIAARARTTDVARDRDGRAIRLFRMASEGLATAYRRSRERQEMGRVASLARTGRETGVKC